MIIRNLEALFTIKTNAVQFKRAASELDNLASKAEGVMKAIAGYWAVQALQNFVTNTAMAMAEVGKTAGYLGITVEALQEMRFAAEKSGVAIDTLEDSLKELQIRSVDAKSGAGEAAEAFAKLDLKPTDMAGHMREPLELLDEVADRVNALPSQADRLWVVDSIFGDQGAKMLKMLKDGSRGLKDMRHEARSLGVVLSTEATAKAAKFSLALNNMKMTSQGVSNSLTDALMGPLSWLLEKISALTTAFNQLENRAAVVRVSLLSLSGILTALAIKVAIIAVPMIAPFLPIIGAIAGIVAGIVALSVVAEDFWVLFKGGESLIGQVCGAMYEGILGIVRFVSSASQAIGKGLGGAWASLRKEFGVFSEWISRVATSIRERFTGLFDGLIPDFLKKNFTATLKTVGVFGNQAQQLNSRLAPTPSSISHHNRNSNQQNVSVAVHVKSGANPQEIGGEVSRALRKELERERFNAFMGVTQYAG